MTDKEMALRLGNFIIKLQREIEALEQVFAECKVETPQGKREIPFRQIANEIAHEVSFLKVSAARQRDLREAVGAETQCLGLIRALYCQFLEEK